MSNVAFNYSISCLRFLCDNPGNHIVVGDFNLPKINWCLNIIPGDFKSQEVFNWSIDCGLEQLNYSPTRFDSILDLVFCDDPLLISDLSCKEPFCLSDHDTLCFKIIPEVQVENCIKTVKVTLQWNRADWDSFNLFCVMTDWYELFKGCNNVSDYWQIFVDFFNAGINRYVPRFTSFLTTGASKKKKSQSKPCKSVRRLRVKKRKLWLRAKRNPNPTNIRNYKLIAKNLKKAAFATNLNHEKHVLLSGNIGAFYKHINARLSHKNGISSLKSKNDTLASSDLEKAETLNNFFVNIGTIDNGTIPHIQSPTSKQHLSHINFNAVKVGKAIDGLKNKSSPGPDGLPPILFKKLKPSIKVHGSLMYLFKFHILCRFTTAPLEKCCCHAYFQKRITY